MVAHPTGDLPALTDLYVYVTDRCNCACVHCWIVDGAPRAGVKAGNFLSPEVLEEAILEASPLGLAAIKWTGGEPTIHPDFPALLALQKRHGLRGRMETNGLRVTLALAELLAESGVDHVSVSLDGARPETHDAIRGMPGAYAGALAGLWNLTAVGYRPQLIMSLMRANVAELESLLELAREVGAGSVKLNIVQPNLRGETLHAAGEALPVADLIGLNKTIERDIARRYPLPIYFDIPLAFRSLTSILSDGAPVCGIKNILGLLADGAYALCGIGAHVQELVFGMAGVDALAKIWRTHPTLEQIRAGLPDGLQGVCAECVVRSACLGMCVAQSYHTNRDILAENWFCRTAAARGLFPLARRLAGA